MGDQSQTLTVTADEDTDFDDETVELGFGALPTAVSEGSPASTTVTLADDDGAALTVSFQQAQYTATEGETGVTVTVALSQATDRVLAIPLTSAPATGDFTLSATSVDFAVGDQSQTLTVTADEDTDFDDETVELGFGALPTAVSEGSPASTTVTLADDDGAALTVSFQQAQYTATEGETGVTVTVSLDQATDRVLAIPLTSAPATGDFTLSATSVDFAVGDQSQTLTVTADEDTDFDDETVELGFGALPTAVSEGSPASTTVTLADDDGAALTVSFQQAQYTATEGETGVTVTVSLDQATDRVLAIPLTSAPATGDFTLSATSVDFAVGDQSQTLTVTADEDTDFDDETVELGFGALPTAVSEGSPASTTVTLADDDGAALTVSFQQAQYTATEGETGVTVTVSLDQATDRVLAIPLTSSPATGDFTLSATSLSFAVGDQSQTLTVTADEDTDFDDETVELGFGTLPTAVSEGSPASTTVTLADDDGAALTVSFQQAQYTATEGETGVTVTVSLSQATDRVLNIPLTSAPATGDFTLSATSVDFAVGDQSQTLTVTADEDTDFDDETVELGFGALPTAVSEGSPASTTVTLADDDGAALTVSFQQAQYTATEGETGVTVTVSLDQATDRVLAIPLTSAPATGDFTLSATSVDFAVGDQSQTLTVTADEDTDFDDETVELGFGTLPTAVSEGSPASTTVTLADDDGAALTVSFQQAQYTATEGETGVTVTVSLDQATDRVLAIPLTSAPATGDFTLSATSVDFAVGDQSQTLTVTADEDTDFDDETVELGFGTLPTAVSEGSPASTTVTLADDDGAALTVSFQQAQYTATEGETGVTVTVSLDQATDRVLTIPLTSAPATGDFTLSATSVDFAVGDQSQTLTVTADEDTDFDDETVELGFGTLPTAVSEGSPASTTVTLADDDGAALTVSFQQAQYTATEGETGVTVTVA